MAWDLGHFEAFEERHGVPDAAADREAPLGGHVVGGPAAALGAGLLRL